MSVAMYVGYFIIPTGLFLFNLSIRLNREVPQSAAADMVLVLIGLNFLEILDSGALLSAVNSQFVTDNLISLCIGLIVVGLVLWSALILVEREVSRNFYRAAHTWQPVALLVSFLGAWVLALTLLFTNFWLFVYRDGAP